MVHLTVSFELDGRAVTIPSDAGTLLDALRGPLGITTVKDGCAPQGQCGCCTVLVDGQPRVSCVTPVRRVAGRRVTTVEGLADGRAWAEALCATGGTQCGFCTPGIVVRLSALAARGSATTEETARALGMHLCRCTGWQPILEAVEALGTATCEGRDLAAASVRATIEGGVAQRVGPEMALGGGGFAADTAPDGCLVALPDGAGGWVVGESTVEARAAAGKIQGRRTTLAPRPPLELPPGDWVRTLRTTWVEPAYLETDASWCEPGGEPASPLANGGAFGAKSESPAPAAARALADRHGRAVLVLLPREEAVRVGPKRPPVAAGLAADGTATVRVVATSGIRERILSVRPDWVVEEIGVPGPPTSIGIRGAGWAEAVVLTCSLTERDVVRTPEGAEAEASVGPDGIHVRVRSGDPLDVPVLRSYAIGAAHQGYGWVTSEGLAVDDDGTVLDLTIRSFGVVRAADLPPVHVEVEPAPGPAVRGSDAVFAAVAAATWRSLGYPPEWPARAS